TALLVTALASAAEPPPSPHADVALALCKRAGQTDVVAEKAALLKRGLALAEETVAQDDRDARAHFAVFCNLGKQLELHGRGVGSLVALRQLRREVDRTLELAPDFPDALVGKASLLLGMPGVLGGDAAKAETLLRRAIAI